jgi:ankyrin repeat protein
MVIHLCIAQPFKGNKEIVELLLANGANVNIKDAGGRIPLDEANRRGHKDIVELLRKNEVEK